MSPKKKQENKPKIIESSYIKPFQMDLLIKQMKKISFYGKLNFGTQNMLK